MEEKIINTECKIVALECAALINSKHGMALPSQVIKEAQEYYKWLISDNAKSPDKQGDYFLTKEITN